MTSTLELARICGVSQGTVDRALHGRPGVSERTRELVLKAAAQHGYRPHPAAREILTGKSKTIQAVVPTVTNIFFMDLLDHLGAALAKNDLTLQIAIAGDADSLRAILEDSAARRHQAALVIPPSDGIALPASLTRSLPVLSLLSPCRGNVTFLSPDEELTGAAGADHLISRGHGRIGFLTSSRKAYAIAARAEGYRRRMTDAGLQPILLQDPDPDRLCREVKSHRLTALFCHNDWLALTAILAFQEHGLRVPQDISVLGVDNSPTLVSIFPGLTTLAYPIASMVEAVMSAIGGSPSVAVEGFEIVERDSVSEPGDTRAGSQLTVN